MPDFMAKYWYDAITPLDLRYIGNKVLNKINEIRSKNGYKAVTLDGDLSQKLDSFFSKAIDEEDGFGRLEKAMRNLEEKIEFEYHIEPGEDFDGYKILDLCLDKLDREYKSKILSKSSSRAIISLYTKDRKIYIRCMLYRNKKIGEI
jgi:hypothetical protein